MNQCTEMIEELPPSTNPTNQRTKLRKKTDPKPDVTSALTLYKVMFFREELMEVSIAAKSSSEALTIFKNATYSGQPKIAPHQQRTDEFVGISIKD